MIDLNDEEQVKATIEEAGRRWADNPRKLVERHLIDLLRSDWKPEDWRLVKALEIASVICRRVPDDNEATVKSALAAIRWCEEQGFKKP